MTGFEQATLTLQHVALWISAVAAAANVIAAAGIWHGIRAMVRANKDRAVILDRQREADDKRHKDAMAAHAEAMAEGARRHEEAMKEGARRHEEAMAALAAQREADERRHEEAMNEGARRHEEAMAGLGALSGGLERQIVSLESVVERTGPLRMGFEESDPGPAE